VSGSGRSAAVRQAGNLFDDGGRWCVPAVPAEG